MTGQKITHYSILEKLGEGGMGVVHKARDLALDREVAIKFLPSHLNKSGETKARFQQEAKAAAALSHPNIMGVFEIGEWEGSPFFVMEYLEGETLKSRMARLHSATGMPLGQALEWARQIAQGLQAAHEKNVVHRDIKPENIMIMKDGTVKIMDFGVAKLKSSSGLTRTGSSIGTLSYMSPEQAEGIDTDHRSDIWSLGVVLYEMLTGERPFKAEHDAGLLYLIVNDEPPLPSEMDRKLPRQVDPVVKRMMEKDRSRRFATMAEVLHALNDLRSSVESSGPAVKTKAIAVLPFGNISPDKESDYFSDGLTEELIAHLSRLKDIRVVPRATSMQYKGTAKDVRTVARELGTRYILAGSVRKFQDNLRITVELIDVDTDAQLWAETYKGKLEDVFDIQENVSKQIVEALMVKLTPKEQVVLTKRATLNSQAFDCNLRARDALYRYTKTGAQTAIELFQKAIEYDARYADAYAGLSEAYATLYQQFDRKETWLEKALESGLKALMYDPSLSEAYSALGLVYLHKKAYDEALESSRKAIELDPNNLTAYWILGRTYLTMDRVEEARDLFRKTISLNADYYSAYSDYITALERLGDRDGRDEAVRTAIGMFPRYLSLHPDDARAHIHYAIFLVQSGAIEKARAEAARAIELSPNDPMMYYNAACFYANIGDKPRALEYLRSSITSGYEFYEWIKRDPDMETIRGEPGYVELMRGK